MVLVVLLLSCLGFAEVFWSSSVSRISDLPYASESRSSNGSASVLRAGRGGRLQFPICRCAKSTKSVNVGRVIKSEKDSECVYASNQAVRESRKYSSSYYRSFFATNSCRTFQVLSYRGKPGVVYRWIPSRSPVPDGYKVFPKGDGSQLISAGRSPQDIEYGTDRFIEMFKGDFTFEQLIKVLEEGKRQLEQHRKLKQQGICVAIRRTEPRGYKPPSGVYNPDTDVNLQAFPGQILPKVKNGSPDTFFDRVRRQGKIKEDLNEAKTYLKRALEEAREKFEVESVMHLESKENPRHLIFKHEEKIAKIKKDFKLLMGLIEDDFGSTGDFSECFYIGHDAERYYVYKTKDTEKYKQFGEGYPDKYSIGGDYFLLHVKQTSTGPKSDPEKRTPKGKSGGWKY